MRLEFFYHAVYVNACIAVFRHFIGKKIFPCSLGLLQNFFRMLLIAFSDAMPQHATGSARFIMLPRPLTEPEVINVMTKQCAPRSFFTRLCTI